MFSIRLRPSQVNKFKRFKSNHRKQFNDTQYKKQTRKYTENKDPNDSSPPHRPMSPAPDFKPTLPFQLIIGTGIIVGGIYYFYSQSQSALITTQEENTEEQNVKTHELVQNIQHNNVQKTLNAEPSHPPHENIAVEEDTPLKNHESSVSSLENLQNDILTHHLTSEDDILRSNPIIDYPEDNYKDKYYELLNSYLKLKESTVETSRDLDSLKSVIKQYQDIILTTSTSIDTQNHNDYQKYKVKLVKKLNKELNKEEMNERASISEFLDNLTNVIKIYEIEKKSFNGQDLLYSFNEAEALIQKFEERDKMQNTLAELAKHFLNLQNRLSNNPQLPFDKQFNDFKSIAKDIPSLQTALTSIPDPLTSIGTPTADVLNNQFKSSFRGIKIENEKRKASILDFQKYKQEWKDQYENRMNSYNSFVKASHYLDQNDVKKCLEELEKVRDEDKAHLAHWLEIAHKSEIVQNGMSYLTTEMIKLFEKNTNKQM